VYLPITKDYQTDIPSIDGYQAETFEVWLRTKVGVVGKRRDCYNADEEPPL
jgi:hypothetical protein